MRTLLALGNGHRPERQASDNLRSLRRSRENIERFAKMPISPSDIKNLVLKEDDFGHEMRVGKLIRNIPNINTQHGGTYIDSVSGKPRQFDFRCSLQKNSAEINLAVECKNLNTSAPLVVCGTKRQKDEAFHDLIGWPGSVGRSVAYTSRPIPTTFRAIEEFAFYRPNKFVGKTLVRMKPNPNPSKTLPDPFVSISDSDIYDKWAQALSSSIGLIKSVHERAVNHRGSEFRAAILPVLVVPDDSLWKVDYDENGSVNGQPEQVNSCELFIDRLIKISAEDFPHPFIFSHIHFFTITGFSLFLSSLTSDDTVWNELFTKKASSVFDNPLRHIGKDTPTPTAPV